MRPHTYYKEIDDKEVSWNEFADEVFKLKKEELTKERRRKKGKNGKTKK